MQKDTDCTLFVIAKKVTQVTIQPSQKLCFGGIFNVMRNTMFYVFMFICLML